MLVIYFSLSLLVKLYFKILADFIHCIIIITPFALPFTDIPSQIVPRISNWVMSGCDSITTPHNSRTCEMLISSLLMDTTNMATISSMGTPHMLTIFNYGQKDSWATLGSKESATSDTNTPFLFFTTLRISV